MKTFKMILNQSDACTCTVWSILVQSLVILRQEGYETFNYFSLPSGILGLPKLKSSQIASHFNFRSNFIMDLKFTDVFVKIREEIKKPTFYYNYKYNG